MPAQLRAALSGGWWLQLTNSPSPMETGRDLGRALAWEFSPVWPCLPCTEKPHAGHSPREGPPPSNCCPWFDCSSPEAAFAPRAVCQLQIGHWSFKLVLQSHDSMIHLGLHRDPRSLHSCCPDGVPQYILGKGLFLPGCRALLFLWLNCRKFLSAPFSSLSRSFWVAAQPSHATCVPAV